MSHDPDRLLPTCTAGRHSSGGADHCGRGGGGGRGAGDGRGRGCDGGRSGTWSTDRLSQLTDRYYTGALVDTDCDTLRSVPLGSVARRSGDAGVKRWDSVLCGRDDAMTSSPRDSAEPMNEVTAINNSAQPAASPYVSGGAIGGGGMRGWMRGALGRGMGGEMGGGIGGGRRCSGERTLISSSWNEPNHVTFSTFIDNDGSFKTCVPIRVDHSDEGRRSNDSFYSRHNERE